MANCECNASIFEESDLINISEIFGQPMQMLYNYKIKCEQDRTENLKDRFDARIGMIKKMMNFSIQCSAQKNKIEVHRDDYEKDDENHDILESCPWQIVYVEKDNYYLHKLARIMPYLLAHARSKIRNVMLRLENSFKCEVIRCHTDSMLINKTITASEIKKIDKKFKLMCKQKFIDLIRCENNTKVMGEFKLKFEHKTI